MMTNNPFDSPTRLADQAAASADQAIRSTQRVANEALDALSTSVQEAHDRAVPALDRGSEKLAALAQRGLDTVRESSQHLREKALHASDSTVGYVRDEPVKAMLIAAATGAVLMALIGLLTRSRERG